jgi:hypothetical protein
MGFPAQPPSPCFCAVNRIVITIAWSVVTQTLLFAADPSAETVAFFESKIRPVLVEHCYECHAAGAKELGGSLMVDSRNAMLEGGESGPIVVAGDPDASLLIQALRHDGLEMPPETPLPESVINDFVRWIKRGAMDPRDGRPTRATVSGDDRESLWSFLPRKQHDTPRASNPSWPRDPIDNFALARIDSAGLFPTRDADPRTLVRRLYFDLIGLPPTFDQVERFAERCDQNRQEAVRRLVDELLASPAFGQHWGKHWLDVARYGESNGDDGLGRNASFPHAWRYRDYVVDALNNDVPYDRFVTEQIAGDLLPAKDAAERNRQLTATGFLAIGSKPAKAMNNNFAMDVVDDQINVVCTAVMGLSVACARCHDHKHDPIPTRDYYAIAGIFSSTETLYGLAANEKLTAPPTPLHELRSDWQADEKPIDRSVTPVFPAGYCSAIDNLGPAIHLSLGSEPQAVKVQAKKAIYTPTDYAEVEGASFDGKLSSSGDYSVGFWFNNRMGNDQRAITAYLFSRGKLGDKQLPGDHLGIGGTHEPSRTGKLFIFNGNQAKVSVAGSTVIPPDTWNHIAIVRAGQRVVIYLNGVREIETELKPTFGDSTDFRLANRSDNFSPLTGNVAEFAIFARALSDQEATTLHAASGQPKGRRTEVALAMGVREKKQPANAKIHINGDGKKLGPEVPRGFLTAHREVAASISGEDKLQQWQTTVQTPKSGRSELAAWLTRSDHPQTARVLVNRVWQHLFGRGIVVSSDDFGVYGARPTHPHLLDHLAERMVDQGWSIKQLIRTIVLSRTYGLSSDCDESLLVADPENIWMARHSRRRLDAEPLRDSMLVSSGALDRQLGQGSVIGESDVLINWPPGEASNLHRPSNLRSVYLCRLRHAPPPELAAFDLPDGIAVAGVRAATTLPTQALFLLNSEFVVAQSRQLARMVVAGSMAGDSRVTEVFRRTLQRDPTKTESNHALDHVQSVYDSLVDQDEDDRRLHSWASLCQALLTANEFRYID